MTVRPKETTTLIYEVEMPRKELRRYRWIEIRHMIAGLILLPTAVLPAFIYAIISKYWLSTVDLRITTLLFFAFLVCGCVVIGYFIDRIMQRQERLQEEVLRQHGWDGECPYLPKAAP